MNLVKIVGERIASQVLALGHSEKEWRVLIIDHSTAKLLHHALPMSEVLSRNIAMVERIEEARAPSNDFSAIYFISANAQNIKKIEKDVSDKLYSSVFVVSITEIQKKEENALESLAKKAEKQRAKGNSEFGFMYKAVLFDFVPLGEDLFHIETPYSYYTDKERYFSDITKKIKGVYRTVQVRCTPIPVGLYAKKLAEQIESTGPGKLVIMERGSDMNTPLMHTFTFESLLWDLGLSGPGYVVEKVEEEAEKNEEESDDTEDEKRLEMNESYQVWESVRNKQLVETHKTLTGLIREETESREKEGKTNIKKLVKAVQELPSQTRTLKEIKILMGLLEKCVSFFNSLGIKEAAELEQGISTGKDFKGNNFKPVVTKTLFSVLKESKLTKNEKYRLYLLYLLNYGNLQRNEEKKLIIKGLISQKDVEHGEVVKTHLSGRAISSISKRSLPIARHVPLVVDVLHAIINKDSAHCKKLEIDLPDSTDALTGGSLRKREFVFKANPSSENVHKRVIVVYFIGGVSIAEISEIREIAKNTGKKILIGSTDVCSPNTFVETLRKLS
ncbi:syntaxin-binding protein 2 [Nematocida minor]|uniref:syntaxin-binding protein 2 n=1 Tax=Nematocida minor TaxID=1912983 RepID=UPI00221F51C6|nr:syntaxin-binding protein 2 [Nematocida minor]KAI5192134.1 syntaxin-binding protein 2 [Nematocida minor]